MRMPLCYSQSIRKNDEKRERMKNLNVKFTWFLGAAFFMGLSAHAQRIKVSIPFAFEANGKSLPAGEYVVRETTAKQSNCDWLRRSIRERTRYDIGCNIARPGEMKRPVLKNH
jgi:hypothetical protein